jgi:tryptophan-rich sensory protein
MTTSYSWYESLIKPWWAPPAWLFGPVWTVLYAIIIVSFIFVFYQAYIGKISWANTIPFILNLILNFAFTPLQFGLRSLLLASIDIVGVLATIIWMFIVLWPFARWVVFVNIPYLVWVSFATILQISITYLNR